MRAILQAPESVPGELVTPAPCCEVWHGQGAPGDRLLVSGWSCSSLVIPLHQAEAGLQDTYEVSSPHPLTHTFFLRTLSYARISLEGTVLMSGVKPQHTPRCVH